jgi:hypothetical protein
MPTNGSVILSEANDPVHACGASGNGRHSRDADDLAAKLLDDSE